MQRALQRFENLVSRVLEGRLAGWLGAKTQPVDLARRLADHMEDRRSVGAGKLYVPNNFRVHLAPDTLASFSNFESGLEDELVSFLGQRAAEADYHFVGRLRVTLLSDPALRPQQIHIESDLVDARGVVLDPAGAQHTTAIQIGPPPEEPPERELVFWLGTRRLPLAEGPAMTIGRALDCDLIVDEASVSRHHARLLRRGAHWMIEDLGSTHGTFLNGHQISASLLREGDRIEFGGVVARIAAPEAEKA